MNDLKQQDIDAALVDLMSSCAKDPYRFAQIGFEWGKGDLAGHEGLEKWQAEVLMDVRDELITIEQAIQIAVASGHGIGKSALIAILILWALSTKEDTVGVVTANTETQLKTKTWRELKIWHRRCITAHWFKVTATAIYSLDPEHEKTWRVDMVNWSAENPEAFAGLHNKGRRAIILFDEASAIPDNIWEVTEGAETDADTEILWVAFGNPTMATGRFRECFRKYRKRWITRQVDSRTVSLTNKAKLESWIEDYGIDSDFVKIRVLGVFPVMSSRQFISTEDADSGRGKHLPESAYSFAPKILACDPAWEGDDELVIGLRQGLHFQILRVIAKNNNDIEIGNLLARLEDEHSADAVFIDGGYGTGIVSAGRTMGRNWQIVWFGGESNDKGYKNKRAEMWGGINTWLKEGGAYPDSQEIYDDLTGICTVPRADGVIQLEAKKDMKKRGLPSPNRADCLALTFAQPVLAKVQNNMPSLRQQKKEEEYNPYAMESDY